MNTISARIFAGIMGIIFLSGSGLCYQETSQKTDPFYLKRLESGERAFLAGDIEAAVEELEIAFFGLDENNKLKAKACLYLGLSQHILKNNEKAEEYLAEAKNLIGMEGLKEFIPDESVWSYLNRVLAELKMIEPEQKQTSRTGTPSRSPFPKSPRNTRETNIAQDLELQIRSKPRQVSLYYELYEYHQNLGEVEAAKKTLKDLIEKNPYEAKGYYLLGRIQYKQRNLKDAEKSLNKVFEIQKKAPVDEYVLEETAAYQILTYHLQGNRERSIELFAKWIDHFDKERIRFLDMDEQDRSILSGISQSEATLAAIETIKSQTDAASGTEQGSLGAETQSSGETSTQDDAESSGTVKAGDLVPLNQVDKPPVLIKKVDPKYPTSAKALGIEGQVLASALISETGDVVEVVIVQGLAGGCNAATVTALTQWKYEPAIKDGQKVRVWKPITITFKKQ
jgi:TonB family protein